MKWSLQASMQITYRGPTIRCSSQNSIVYLCSKVSTCRAVSHFVFLSLSASLTLSLSLSLAFPLPPSRTRLRIMERGYRTDLVWFPSRRGFDWRTYDERSSGVKDEQTRFFSLLHWSFPLESCTRASIRGFRIGWKKKSKEEPVVISKALGSFGTKRIGNNGKIDDGQYPLDDSIFPYE